MTKPTPTNQRSFAERFESLDDAIPLSLEEAKAILADAGIDPAEGMKRLFVEMDNIDATARQGDTPFKRKPNFLERIFSSGGK